MIITQTQLTEDQIINLEKYSKKYNISVSELIRKGVDMLIKSLPELTKEEKGLPQEKKIPLFIVYNK